MSKFQHKPSESKEKPAVTAVTRAHSMLVDLCGQRGWNDTRESWLARGGLFVCHHCDNRPCFEITHLFLGTAADNNADKLAKGRSVYLPGERNGRARLTREQVAAIIADRRAHGVIAREYGIQQPQVSRIKRGASWANA